MRGVFLFAYGTLQDDAVQRRVFGRRIAARPAQLRGWRIVANQVRDRYPGVARQAGGATRGGLPALRTGELARADRYEDAPRLYRRIRVVARSGRGSVRCWVYVPNDTIRAGVARRGRARLAARS